MDTQEGRVTLSRSHGDGDRTLAWASSPGPGYLSAGHMWVCAAAGNGCIINSQSVWRSEKSDLMDSVSSGAPQTQFPFYILQTYSSQCL